MDEVQDIAIMHLLPVLSYILSVRKHLQPVFDTQDFLSYNNVTRFE